METEKKQQESQPVRGWLIPVYAAVRVHEPAAGMKIPSNEVKIA